MNPTVLMWMTHSGFRSLARRLLTAGGFEVVGEAADGHAAITAAHQLRPDVVLVDVQLPDVDATGRQVEPPIRRRPSRHRAAPRRGARRRHGPRPRPGRVPGAGPRGRGDRPHSNRERALDELRELARGIHPVILGEAGLGPALASLAERSAVPVTLASVPPDRLPPRVEETAYYVASEALANAAKHARATAVTISARRLNGELLVEVRDDGVGGADPDGSGLRGLADRVAALDGHLRVDSPAGQGTRITAELPCGW